MVQVLLNDPVLYKGYKMDFRIYMFVNSASSQRITFYEGFARVCPFRFDPASFLPQVQVSNLRKSLRSENEHSEVIEGEPRDDFLVKNYNEVQEYLKKTYEIDFLDKVDKVQEGLTEIFKGSQISKRLDSQFQLFAVDFIVKRSGGVAVLEVNAFPDFIENSSKKSTIYSKLFNDVGRRIWNKIYRTRQTLVEMVEEENFNETRAIERVGEIDL